MLNHIVEKVREKEVFYRDDTCMEKRVLGVFLYHAGLSYREVGKVVGRSYETVRLWYNRLSELFNSSVGHKTIAVDETKLKLEDEEVYVWVAVDVDTFEVIYVDVSRGRSSLDALLFLRKVLKQCRGKPLIKIDRGPWYNWSIERLDCDFERETFGERSLVERWFGVLKHRTSRFWDRFPYNSSIKSIRKWLRSFAKIHNITL